MARRKGGPSTQGLKAFNSRKTGRVHEPAGSPNNFRSLECEILDWAA
jgi:hypothetical protein